MHVTTNGPGKSLLTGVTYVNMVASGPLEEELLRRLVVSMQTRESRIALYKFLEQYKNAELKRAGL